MTTAATFSRPWLPALVWVSLSALAFGGCNLVDIEITSPAQGAEVVVGEPVTIEVSIGGDEAPEVQEVAFYRLVADSDAVLLARDTRAPYQATWTPSASALGTVVLQAVATDSDAKNLGIAFSEVTVVTAPSSVPGLLGTLSGVGRSPLDVAVDAASELVAIANSQFGLTFVDVSNPTNPRMLSTTGILTLAVQMGDGIAFAVEGVPGLPAKANLVVIDLQDPARPRIAARMALHGSFAGGGGIVLQQGIAYIAATDAGLLVVDVRNPFAPSLMGEVAAGFANGLTVSGDRAIVLNKNRTFVVDVGDPTRPTVVARFGKIGEGDPSSRGDLVFFHPLKIIDFSRPDSPSGVSNTVVSKGRDLAITGNLAAVGGLLSMNFFDISDPAAPVLLESNESTPALVVAASPEIVVGVDNDGNLNVFSVN